VRAGCSIAAFSRENARHFRRLQAQPLSCIGKLLLCPTVLVSKQNTVGDKK
jgi:hypothetical protein